MGACLSLPYLWISVRVGDTVLHLTQRTPRWIKVSASCCHFPVLPMNQGTINLQLRHHPELSTVMCGTQPGPTEIATCQTHDHTLQSVLIIIANKRLAKTLSPCLRALIRDGNFYDGLTDRPSNFPSAAFWQISLLSHIKPHLWGWESSSCRSEVHNS